jgi:hypothetical protein
MSWPLKGTSAVKIEQIMTNLKITADKRFAGNI